jgi:hypothetical protein
MADELRPQLGYVRRVVEALRLPVIEVPGVEADDVIGTLAAQAARAGLGTVIVTADKDMMQLVDERTTMLDTVRGRRIGPAEVRERFGVDPPLVPDVLGLMGDSIDNIPGVKGIGEKTAMRLVSQLGAVERVLERLDEIEGLGLRGAKRIRDALAAEAETARLSKTLATIRRDVDVALDLERLRWDGPDPEKVRPLFIELEFASLLGELLPTGVATPAVEHTVLSTPEAVREGGGARGDHRCGRARRRARIGACDRCRRDPARARRPRRADRVAHRTAEPRDARRHAGRPRRRAREKGRRRPEGAPGCTRPSRHSDGRPVRRPFACVVLPRSVA